MTRFAKELAEIRDRLEIPEPARSRLLLEMAADLEDSYRYHRQKGRDRAEAERLAAEAFATSDETLRLLGKLHGSDLAGTADRFSQQLGAWWSKLLLLALALILFTFGKLAQILSRQRIELRRLREGLTAPLFLAATSLAVSFLGFLFHLQRFFRLTADQAPESLSTHFAGWMVSISSLMTVGLLTAILGGADWFVLSGLVTRAEAREIEGLLGSA